MIIIIVVYHTSKEKIETPSLEYGSAIYLVVVTLAELLASVILFRLLSVEADIKSVQIFT